MFNTAYGLTATSQIGTWAFSLATCAAAAGVPLCYRSH
jgi:hypothetical protein